MIIFDPQLETLAASFRNSSELMTSFESVDVSYRWNLTELDPRFEIWIKKWLSTLHLYCFDWCIKLSNACLRIMKQISLLEIRQKQLQFLASKDP
ncbi:hypothetical protein Nepgr_009244 [Nepenthes gracilis]|uniref:Uncharacterized protein n=1 Tax=Nepenthes gracilis TaxID=150966 RepID=A0AAD3SB06_NEPGR|nr:hypothetical protein Nepgr_009244 [Nepenthes gracilis]